MRQFRFSLQSLVATFVFCIVIASGAISVKADDDDDDDDIYGIFVPNQIVVKLDAASGVAINDINATYSTTTLENFLDSAAIYLLQTPTNANTLDILEQMESDSRLLYAEPNFIGEAPEDDGRGTKAWAGQDPSPSGVQYAVELLNVPEAHAISQGAGITVAVLDTGIQANHPAFANALTSVRYDFIDDDTMPDDVANGVDDDANGEIDEGTGHGTHVAGIVKLAAPQAKLMPLRVLDSDGRGNVFVIAEAVAYAAQHGAQVINLSLGTSDDSELLAEILEEVVEDHDVVVVAAAGNLNHELEQYPAANSDILAVTAINANSQKANIANFGSWVGIAAPGESIHSAFPPNGYAWWTGTSMAAPFVAGQAALLRSYCPELKADDTISQIQSTAFNLDSLNPDYSGKLGKGRADFAASLQVECSGNHNNDDDDDIDDDIDDDDVVDDDIDDDDIDDDIVDDDIIDDDIVDDDIVDDDIVDDDIVDDDIVDDDIDDNDDDDIDDDNNDDDIEQPRTRRMRLPFLAHP